MKNTMYIGNVEQMFSGVTKHSRVVKMNQLMSGEVMMSAERCVLVRM